MSNMMTPSLQVSMNELSNHDHSRFLTRTNHRVGRISYAGPEAASEGVNPAVMREAVTIQMTWPGAPTVYYGDEAGLCGFTAHWDFSGMIIRDFVMRDFLMMNR